MPTKHKVIKKEDKNTNDFLTYEWSAPGRPFKIRTKQYFLTILLIMLLIEIILFLFSQYALMFAVAALVFVSFALSIVPPKDFVYRITPEGFQLEDKFYLWNELHEFYLYKHYGEETIHIPTKDLIPGELIITLGNQKAELIKNILIKYLPFREYVKPAFMDKSADWLSRNFPLDDK